MTTIYVDKFNKKMYADTLVTWGDNSFEQDKVMCTKDLVIGISGNLNTGQAIQEGILDSYEDMSDSDFLIFLKEFFQKDNILDLADKEKLTEDDYFNIVILHKNECYIIDGFLKVTLLHSNITIGSGSVYAKLLFNTITSKNGDANFYSQKMSKIKQQKFDDIFVKYLKNISSIDKFTNDKIKVYTFSK